MPDASYIISLYYLPQPFMKTSEAEFGELSSSTYFTDITQT